jgi:transposase
VRVTTAFDRMLGIPGAQVTGFTFATAGLVVRLRHRRRKTLCCPCGYETGSVYDRRVRRWRHLDLKPGRDRRTGSIRTAS